MRESVLTSSVRALLPNDERIVALVHMWRRHRLMVPFVLASFTGVLVVAILAGFEEWSGRIGLALGAGALAAMATTEYRVLALTSDDDLVLFRSSRVRQKATELLVRLPESTVVEPAGTNLVITDWKVADHIYSVMRRYQSAMVAISER